MICACCLTHIQPGQLYVPEPRADWGFVPRPVHVACPTEHEIAHARRMGRPL